MPEWTVKKILSIDPNADVELVGDIADERHRIFSRMTHEQWVECVRAGARS